MYVLVITSNFQRGGTVIAMASIRTSSSLFACYIPCVVDNDSCVLETSTAAKKPESASSLWDHPSENIMRRASSSRRQGSQFSPPMRSRSSERIDEKDLEEVKQSLNSDELQVDSERVHEQKRSFHRRSMSDPFDAQEEQAKEFLHLKATEGEVLPTLPRYPVAETRNKNCWSEPPVTIFHVRGPDYLTTKKKLPSASYLLPARGCDLFLSNNSKDPVNLDTKYVK